MIERITTPKQVISIIKVTDKQLTEQVLTPMNMSLMEWIQFLESHISETDKMGMWGQMNNDNVEKYILVFSAVAPPISNSCLHYYQNFFKSKEEYEDNKEEIQFVYDEVKEWTRSLGAIHIDGIESDDNLCDIYKELGFLPGGTIIRLVV